MRLISSFKDYYDAVQGTDLDRSVVYVRETKQLEGWGNCFGRFRLYRDNSRSILNTARSDYRIDGALVAFCGRAYPAIVFDPVHLTSDRGDKLTQHVCYSLEQIDKFVETYQSKKYLEEVYLNENKYHTETRRSIDGYFTREQEDLDRNQNIVLEYQLKHRCPVFVDRLSREIGKENERVTILNPNLKQYQFFKIFDTYSAFQEIRMFMNNLAFPEKQIPEVSDEDLLTAKGFDKFSFRKDKSKKK